MLSNLPENIPSHHLGNWAGGYNVRTGDMMQVMASAEVAILGFGAAILPVEYPG